MATTTRKRGGKKRPTPSRRYVNVGLEPEVHDILQRAANAEDRTLTAQAARWLKAAIEDWDAENPELANDLVSEVDPPIEG